MDHTYDVHLTCEAANDLEQAVNWIKEESPEAAHSFYVALKSRIRTNLTKTPHMGVRLQLVNDQQLFALTCRQYRVFYTVDDDRRRVSIIRILHTSRDIQSILQIVL